MRQVVNLEAKTERIHRQVQRQGQQGSRPPRPNQGMAIENIQIRQAFGCFNGARKVRHGVQENKRTRDAGDDYRVHPCRLHPVI